jgi:phenylpropionate dioxygenase-like ring-hydroxylating dioxygenase large terminal subunit
VREADPTGGQWTTLGPSDDLAAGQIRAFEVDERDLVMWRDLDGRPCVMAARCPHQWSHLEAEGVVDGPEIVCRAHFWRFDQCGVGSKVNVRGRRDRKGDIEVHPCRERAGHLEVWLPRGTST